VVIVDTTVWIDYLGGIRNLESDWLDRELGHQPLGLTDLILCEVLQGYRDDVVFERVLRELHNLEVFEAGGTDLAIAAARNFRRLRRQGFTVRKTIDCWIATFCIRERHSLLHRDRDFDPFEKALGLRVVHP
jgi:predicted nucleic acid-binding protein